MHTFIKLLDSFVPVASDEEVQFHIFWGLFSPSYLLELLLLDIIAPRDAISVLLHEDLLYDKHVTIVIDLAVVDPKVEFSPVTRFVNAVCNVKTHTADLLSADATLLLKLYLSVEDRGSGYREGRREYNFLAGPQHALAILIDNKRGVNGHKLGFKLVYDLALLKA